MNEFRSIPEEVQRLLKEVRDAKETLKTISARLTSIEKHVRRAFQVPRPPHQSKARAEQPRASSMSRDQLLSGFDVVRAKFVESNSMASEELLTDYADEDLRALAKELGVSNTRKLGLNGIRDAVMQKVRESALLGTNALRGAEQSQRTETADASPSRTTGPDA